jgi:uncharacterized protein
MRWKPSTFNRAVSVDGALRLFNARRQSSLSAGLSRRVLDGATLSGLEQRILAGKGMLVPEGLDERGRLFAEFSLRKHNSSLLSLIVAPSYRCNCACPDCFQRDFDKTAVMEARTRAAVVDLLEHAVRMRNPARALLWLSGGEPFACARECLDLAERASARCAEQRVPLTLATTTNGTLITATSGRELARRLDLFYVSLSESAAAQHAQRPFTGGGSSYDAVLRGLAHLGELDKQVIVRFNVASGARGCESVRATLDELYRALGGVAHPRFSFEFSALLCFKEKCFSDPETSTEARAGLGAMAPALLELAQSTAWPRNAFRLPSFHTLPGMHDDEHFEVCDFLRGDSFYVTPSGEAYFCTTKAHDPRYRLGRVQDAHAFFLDPGFTRILNFDPWQDPRCRECALMPLCLTSCPLWREPGLGYAGDTCVAANEARVAASIRRADASDALCGSRA